MALDTDRATELHQRMEAAADDLDGDARALEAPLAEASTLLSSPVPNVSIGTTRVADELRASAADLQHRTNLVLTGGPDMNEGMGALERIREHFAVIESRGRPDRADGLLSRKDLAWAAYSTDPDTAAAASWLLEHDHFFDQVETAKHNDDYLSRVHEGMLHFDRGDRDGLMSLDDIDAFLDKTATWSTLKPLASTIDAAGTGRHDGLMSKEDFEAFLNDYKMSDEEAAALSQVFDDRAFHTDDGGFNWGLVLDAVSFVPVVGDIVDGARAVYYVLQGDYGKAAIFALGVVPIPAVSSSGIRGSIKTIEVVVDVARKSGRKEAAKVAGRLAAKGTAARYVAHQGALRLTDAVSERIEITQTCDYLYNQTAGPLMEDLLDDEGLDPQVRAGLCEKLEQRLDEMVDEDSKFRVSEVNAVISRRLAEHRQFEKIFREIRLK